MAETTDTTDSASEHFYNFAELYESASQPTDWVIENYLPAGETTLAYGESQAGKTFVALDMAMHVATGKPWHGNPVPRARPVLYIASEGRRGIGRRVLTWAYYYVTESQGETIPFEMMRGTFLLDDSDDGETWNALLRRMMAVEPGLVVFDVLSDMTPTIDENTRAFGHAFNRLRTLAEESGAAFLVLHHTGWGSNTKDRPRGSSSVFQAADNAWLIEGEKVFRNGELHATCVTITGHKARNENYAPKLLLRLQKLDPQAPAAHIIGEWFEDDDLTQPLDSSPKLAEALNATYSNPEGVASMQALADLLDITRQAAQKHAKRLIALGYCEEIVSGRSKGLKITEKGRQAIATYSNPPATALPTYSNPLTPPIGVRVALGPDWSDDEIASIEEGGEANPFTDDDDPYTNEGDEITGTLAGMLAKVRQVTA